MVLKNVCIIVLIVNSTLCGFTQNWVQVGNQDVYVKHLFSDTVHNRLFAAGNFVAVNGTDTIWDIAQWDGVYWDSLGTGITSFTSGVECFTLFNGELIVGGGFNSAGGISAFGLAKWNGLNWDSVGTGTYATTFDLLTYNDTLYAVGNISGDGGQNFSSVSKLSNGIWESVGAPPPHGAACNFRAITVYNNEIYVGGSLQSLQNDSIRNIIRWTGNDWKTVANGVPDGYFEDAVKTLQVYHGQLYIGGSMTGGLNNSYDYFGIATWDGGGYTLPGGGIIDGKVYDMTIFNDTLYAVGLFNHAGGIAASNVAKWDGTNWCSLGSSFNDKIYAIEVFNSELYIGGMFTTIDGLPIQGIAKWVGGSYIDQCGNTTSLNESEVVEWEIFPNPTSNFLNVLVSDEEENECNYAINNLIGQMIMSGKIMENNGQIDLTSLSQGIYILELELGNTKINRRIIKR